MEDVGCNKGRGMVEWEHTDNMMRGVDETC